MADTPKKERTRALLLEGAGRRFRSHGYEGSGVDAVAKEGGLTSGAFYAYFKSKADAFRETVRTGMQDLEEAIRTLRTDGDAKWLEQFVDFYLDEKRTCASTETCALQSLSGEVARADEQTRETFEAALRGVVAAAADGLEAPTEKARRSEAIVLLSLLAGGVSLARAVNDPAFSEEIAKAIRGCLLRPEGSLHLVARRAGRKI